MIKLLDLINEEIRQTLKEDFQSDIRSYLNGDYSELYYFGGFEEPTRRHTDFATDSTTAIDFQKAEDNKVWDNYIEADLNKTLNLPPKKVIFVPMGVIDNVESMAKNINNLLKSKGVVVIYEYVTHSKNIVGILTNKYNFKIMGDGTPINKIDPRNAHKYDDYELEGIYRPIILQKP